MDIGSTVRSASNDSASATVYLTVMTLPDGMVIVRDTAVGRNYLDPLWPQCFKGTVEATQGPAEFRIDVIRGFAYLIPRGQVGSPVEVAWQVARLICPALLDKWLDQRRIAAQADTA